VTCHDDEQKNETKKGWKKKLYFTNKDDLFCCHFQMSSTRKMFLVTAHSAMERERENERDNERAAKIFGSGTTLVVCCKVTKGLLYSQPKENVCERGHVLKNDLGFLEFRR
jgi:hypothetical protein